MRVRFNKEGSLVLSRVGWHVAQTVVIYGGLSCSNFRLSSSRAHGRQFRPPSPVSGVPNVVRHILQLVKTTKFMARIMKRWPSGAHSKLLGARRLPHCKPNAAPLAHPTRDERPSPSRACSVPRTATVGRRIINQCNARSDLLMANVVFCLESKERISKF